MQTLLRDIRHAVRGLAARPAYAVIVIATLALVIGATTAVLAVASATLVRPLPYPRGDRLVQLFLMPPGDLNWNARNPFSLGTFLRARQHLRQADLVEGLWARERVLGGATIPEVVVAGAVSPGIFELFGGAPVLGRTLTEDEDRAGAKVVVLGHAVWERSFGGDPTIVGRTVLIDREPYEVVGVMAPGFSTGFAATDLWTPLHATEADVASGNTMVQTFARLRPGVTPGQLQGELGPVMQAAIAENPAMLTGWSTLVVGLRDAQFRQLRPGLLALVGGVLALLLLACANLANLILAQAVARRPQFALRLALGGGTGALVRLQLVEILVLTAAGTTAGVLAGRWVLPLVLTLDPSLARVFGEVGVDWRTQLGTALAALLVALVAGLLPLARELRGGMALADAGSRRSVGSRRDRRLQGVLVGVESALAVLLLTAAAFLLNAFDRSSRVDPGFDPHSVLAAQLRLSATAYPTDAARADLIARVLARVRAVPGVVSAGATLNRFIPGVYFQTRVHIEDKPTPDGQPHVVDFRRASPGYFGTMRIPVVRGRDFSDHDTLDQPPVVIVSRQFAERFWPGEDPVGRRLRRGTGPTWLTVVGVVGDVMDAGVEQPASPTIYVPFGQNNVAITPVSLVLRTAGDPRALAGPIGDAVRSVDPQQPIDSVTTLDRFLADSLGPQRFRSTLLLLLGGIGLALASLGVYGVTARGVTERTAELGVRCALGATPASLLRLVVWQSMRAVLVGLVTGAVLAVPVTAALSRLLPDLDGTPVWMPAPALAVLVVAALVAAVVPASRALQLSPVAALRAE